MNEQVQSGHLANLPEAAEVLVVLVVGGMRR